MWGKKLDQHTIENRDLQDFHDQLVDQVESISEEAASTQLEWDARLAEVVLAYMEETGYADEPVLAPHEDISGRNLSRIVGYGFRDDKMTLEIFTAAFVHDRTITSLPPGEIRRLTGRAARFFDYVAKGNVSRFDDHPIARDAALAIKEALEIIDLVRVHLITNCSVRDGTVDSIEIGGRDVEFSIMDIERLFRTAGRPSSRQDIDVDFVDLLGRPLPVLEVLPSPEEYDTYLAIFPGELIFKLYETYGPRLLEFNVRSFLQARGKVNRGIRDTLRDVPERFLAYNNGLTATADEIEIENHHGQTSIKRLRGLQVVNGGQTTASIHRAKKNDKADISNVAVAVKITRVAENRLEEFVPLISKFSNTQNVIQVSDLSANHPFHISVERLSEIVWCPGEEERWFYERARGAYQVAMSRFGTTPKRVKDFKSQTPTNKTISKTDFAKYIMTWLGRPHDVSRGAQKNFSIFMSELNQLFPTPEWEPDEAFFQETIAKGIVFKAAESVARQEKFPAYRANIITYLVAYFAHRFGGQIDLGFIWEEQKVSGQLKELLRSWSHSINECIIETASGRNVTEWAKKDDCWTSVRSLDLYLPDEPLPEMMDQISVSDVVGVTRADVEPDALRCMAIAAEDWTRIVTWGRNNGRLQEIEWKVARTMADYAMEGWEKRPSPKQLRYAIRALDFALADGVVSPDAHH